MRHLVWVLLMAAGCTIDVDLGPGEGTPDAAHTEDAGPIPDGQIIGDASLGVPDAFVFDADQFVPDAAP